MGVLGLTPFLQKTCPEVIKEIPDRLRALAGKTIVIDGTLITQRLHFAPNPHTHRHIIGWYRLIRELKDHDVGAICVFDGDTRNPAKAGEIERRKLARKTLLTRCRMEVERSKRLKELVGVFRNLSSLNNAERHKASVSLRKMVQMTPGLSSPLSITLDNAQSSSAVADSNSAEEASKPFCVPSGGENSSPESPLSNMASIPYQTDCERTDHFSNQLSAYPYPFTHSTTSTGDVSNSLVSLYLDYCHSISRISSLFASRSPDPNDPEDIASDVMSKGQRQLALDEGQVWDSLLACQTIESTETSLQSLADKSSVMAASYLRRSRPATTQTYKESRETLHAMGIPCITPSGPFEAESLAAALVLNGFADYVASEDTDVLVYRAPLLRGLTTRHLPLTAISGADVQDALRLDPKHFLDFALLLGTDFSSRLRGIGPARALQFIRAHDTIEHILAAERPFSSQDALDAYSAQIARARQVFQTLPPVPDNRLLQPVVSDEAAVVRILERYGLQRSLLDHEVDYYSALEGNYFQDDPNIA